MRRHPGDFLSGQTAVVTGGAQGIGWAIVQACAAHGAEVYACDISEENLATAQAQLPDLSWGERIHLSWCDVAERSTYESWLADALAQQGRIDVVINNAAFLRWQPVSDLAVEDIERVMQVGYLAMVYGVKFALPHMLTAGRGSIINIGSSVSQAIVLRNAAAYTAMKAAIDGFTQTLQIEVQKTPIHVGLIRPTTVAGTDFLRKHVLPSQMPRLVDFTPVVTPPQVADAVLRSIHQRRPIINVPGHLPLFYLLFALAPNLFRRLVEAGGTARRDYGQVEWRYMADDQDARHEESPATVREQV